MKLTKNTIRELIKEEIINERERERTPSQKWLNRVRDQYEDVAEDLEDGSLEMYGGKVEKTQEAKDWIRTLRNDYSAMEILNTELNDQKTKIEKEIVRLQHAGLNSMALAEFIGGQREHLPEFVSVPKKPRDDSEE